MKRRPDWSATKWLAWACWISCVPGCAFFGSEYDPCFEEGTCSAGLGGGVSSSGGEGAVASGGRSGSGGDASGGAFTGGQPNDGSGGDGSGGDGSGGDGSGGDGSGGDGSGGDGSGGDGSGGAGTGGGGPTVYRIHFNELLRSTFVEFFGAGSAPTDLSTLFVGESPNDGGCPLGSAGSLSPGQFLEVTSKASCDGTGLCVSGCPFDFIWGDSLYLLSNDEGPLRVIDSVAYPSQGSPGSPTLGQSWSAVPDGSGNFRAESASPGASNQ